MEHRSPLLQVIRPFDNLSLFLGDLKLPSESVDSALGIVYVRLGGNLKSVLSLPGLTDNASQDVGELIDYLA
jgi:hypothetical protein